MLARNSAVAVFSSLAIIGIGYSIAIYRKGSSLLKEAKDQVQKAYLQLIGHTSLIELPELSRLTGCRIFVKVKTHFSTIL
jgi:ABC-type lipoprotein release transport system permease subunit